MGCIYKVSNSVNSKGYIGQTILPPKQRWRNHTLGHNSSRLLQDDIKIYGIDAFVFEILHDGIITEFLNMFEIASMEEHNTLVPFGYNKIKRGNGQRKEYGRLKREGLFKLAQSVPPEQRAMAVLHYEHTPDLDSQYWKYIIAYGERLTTSEWAILIGHAPDSSYHREE